MTTPYDEDEQLDELGALDPAIDDADWCAVLDRLFERTVRRIVEEHDGLCLDTKDEREQLIRALSAALTSTATRA